MTTGGGSNWVHTAPETEAAKAVGKMIRRHNAYLRHGLKGKVPRKTLSTSTSELVGHVWASSRVEASVAKVSILLRHFHLEHRSGAAGLLGELQDLLRDSQSKNLWDLNLRTSLSFRDHVQLVARDPRSLADSPLIGSTLARGKSRSRGPEPRATLRRRTLKKRAKRALKSSYEGYANRLASAMDGHGA